MFEVRYLEAVLDEEPLLSEHLLELAEWIAQYYLAPLGEVLRGMLPLMAEVRRTVYYRHHRSGARCAGGRAWMAKRAKFPAVLRLERTANSLGCSLGCSRAAGASSRRKTRTWSSACWSGWPRASR